RIRRVGAACDRSDHYRAVGQWKPTALGIHFDLVRYMTELRFENCALAGRGAITAFGHPLAEFHAIDARMLLEFLGQLAPEVGLRRRQCNPILRTARSRHTRHDAAEI